VPELPLLTRRDVLRLGTAVAAGASLAACTTASNTGPSQSAPPTPGAPDDPDSRLRLSIAGDEQELGVLYQYVAGLLPAKTAARVTALGARHDAYSQAISPGTVVSPATPEPQSGKDPAVLVKRLRTAETRAAALRAQQSLTAHDTELARLIVLAGAGAASAAEVLRTVTT
jgi:hypothetical protein